MGMATTIMSDPIMVSTQALETQTISTKQVMIDQTEVQFVKCECCGLIEECTPAYIEMIRQRYFGKWMCGLCGEAVKDEIFRINDRLITTEEAITKHMSFCKKFVSSHPPQNPAVHLIAAMRQILRRSLDSPRGLRSPNPTGAC